MAPTPEGVTDPVRSLDVRQRALESRVVRAEQAVARLWTLVVAALLTSGQLLSFLTYDEGEDEVTHSLLTFGLAGLGYRDEDGHRDPSSLVLAVAFAGLSVLAVVALVSLPGLLRRTPRGDARNVRAPVAVLLVIGVLGAWLTALFALSRSSERSPVDLHAGLPVFTVGALLYAWLVISEAGRELWSA